MGAKICIDPGCFTGTTGGPRCPEHEREYQRVRNVDPLRQPRRTREYLTTAIPAGSACVCCGSSEDMTRHHVRPLAWLNPAPSDLVPMCRRCNSSIGAREVEGFTCPLHGGTVVFHVKQEADVSCETRVTGVDRG